MGGGERTLNEKQWDVFEQRQVCNEYQADFFK